MMTAIMMFMMKFLDVDALCQLVAKSIASILSFASAKGGKTWDTTKEIIAKINIWTSLFMQVYEDETLTKDEEALIAEAIKNQTNIGKLVDLVKKEKVSKGTKKSKRKKAK